MNGARYGKGDRPRNNWGPKWDAGYASINWHRQDGPQIRLNSPKTGASPMVPGNGAGKLIHG